MKLHLRLMLVATAFTAISSAAAHGDSAVPASVQSVAKARPCKPSRISVFGYLHASRHGSWISDDPGLNGKGIRIGLAEFESSERERLRRYIFRPQDYSNNTFSAMFTGTISCQENGVPVFLIQKIEHIKLMPIKKDAA